ASLGIKAGYTLDGVPTHRRVHTLYHSLTQSGQFRDANQPTMDVFGLGEETGVPGGKPRGTGRTCKLHINMAEAGIEPPTLEINFCPLPNGIKAFQEFQYSLYTQAIRPINIQNPLPLLPVPSG
ncbi:hypothetical protein QTP86_022975, partial [Hemibagrus guttatus]